MDWIKAFLAAIGNFFKWLGDKQLLDAGEAISENKQSEADNAATAKAKEIKKHVDSLSDSDVADGLSKYRRKDL